ncbi:MAG: VOC family protein [Candidatus Eremiobacteraeota bacterium]|nr:VOC family protein [Candidatus Eremiobacteraeota bacterium]
MHSPAPSAPIAGLTFHHVGVACRNLDAEERTFALLGYRLERPEFFDPIQGVHGRFVTGGGPRLELLRNDTEPGVLTPWLKKGVRFYHVAYEVDDLAAAAATLLTAGTKALMEPVPAVAFGGRPICFYMLPNLSLVELIGAI